METFDTLPPIAQNIAVLLAVISLKFLIARLSPSTKPQPLALFFNFYCQRLAEKVNKEKNSDNQRKIAGTIAVTITAVPLIIIVWLFESFIAVPILWQALLLYFSLAAFNFNHLAIKTAQSIASQNKLETKQLLSPWLARDVEQLSPMGLSKACIEMLILRKSQQLFIVAFYFITFGPLAAFTYRLLLEMHYSWNIKRKQFHSFAWFINKTISMVQWLPIRLLLILVMFININQSILLYWRLNKGLFFKLDNSILISYFSYCLGIKLAGVAMYDSEKIRRLSFNDQGQQPGPNNIITTIKQLNLVFTLALSLLTSLLILISTFVLTR